MKITITWETLGSPTESGVYEVEGIGTVLIRDIDLNPSQVMADNHEIVLMDAKPEADYKINHWQPKGQTFFPS